MNRIIDDVFKMLDMKSDELDELLLDEKYNKANLRQLVRESIHLTRAYKIQLDANVQNEMRYAKLVNQIRDLIQ